VDEVFPDQPVRQCLLRVPYPLRFLYARRPANMGRVLGIVHRCIATHLLKQAGVFLQDGPDRDGHPDPALRQRLEPEHL
jgi:hypothetical protein